MKVLIAIAFVLAAAAIAEAQVRYVDENGTAHWVQTENHVPPQYRAEHPALPDTRTIAGDGATRSSTSHTETDGERLTRIRREAQEQATGMFHAKEAPAAAAAEAYARQQQADAAKAKAAGEAAALDRAAKEATIRNADTTERLLQESSHPKMSTCQSWRGAGGYRQTNCTEQ